LRAGRKKIRSAAKNFSGRGTASTIPRPEILVSLSLKDNFDPPSKGGWSAAHDDDRSESLSMKALKKRSFTIAGHRTSVALEPEFWDVLEREAQNSGSSLAALVASIDATRGARPLASAMRLHALAAAGRAS
jgi:predicted DNA-binding ribbon-helix-helix protein